MPRTAASVLAVRRERDRIALVAARRAAQAAARALLGALYFTDTSDAELERRAREAYDAIGLLWERAARVNE